jgi:hypothetical protein
VVSPSCVSHSLGEDLINKIYDNRSSDEQRRRDTILGREPFASNHNISEPVPLDLLPHARSLKPLHGEIMIDRDGHYPFTTIANFIPYLQWDTEANRDKMHETMKVALPAGKLEIT